MKTLESGLSTYSHGLQLARRSRTFNITSQGVSVCFLKLHEGFYLELVAPITEAQSKLSSYLRTGFYHLCFLTEDISAARAHLKKRRFVALPSFSSEAFAGELCQFFVSPESHLIELAQISPDNFLSFLAHNSADREIS